MSWLERLFPKKPELTPQQAERLAAWQALPVPRQDQPFSSSRYVVVDVETSGLNTAKDHLIAIGAVAVTHGRIRLNDSLEIVLQQTEASETDNILIHGIGGTVQREGVPPADALLTFLEYLGKDPLIAFHVAFDQAMINRALKQFLGLKFEHAWADLAYVAPALHPRIARHTCTLDGWMGLFGISTYARHNALADALSTAELLLALRPNLETLNMTTLRDLKTLEQERRRQIQPG
ncbi:MAG: 3'-5' exonuclease [Sulfuriferula multivorans]|uniref:3'-5' exonuclease n=1 Tax=Sulfuriferula multivorans TaxID=1559896 RepID=A0A7C9JX95_9PROT|nr:3'-5' exonuclease [Sulfuriferula multivorans]